MAAFNKYLDFTRACLAGTHQFGTHTFKAAFTNTAPTNTHTQLSQITQIGTGGGYTGGAGGGLTLDNVSLTTTGGVAKVSIDDEVFTATGSVGPFRYVVLYNDTATNDPLIGWYDYGSSITLNTDESLTLDFDGTNGVLQLV
jgi:hypothetical protein